jgi:Mg-chelatase subunit ChlD
LPHNAAFALQPEPSSLDFAKFPDYSQQANFREPRAQNCKRAIQMRETREEGREYGSPKSAVGKAAIGDLHSKEPSLAKSYSGETARVPSPLAKPAPAAIAPSAATTPSMGPAPSAVPSLQPPQQAVVTAGVVDDNADFGEYLAYRSRTPVPHRLRDVTERYLLQVRDAASHPVHDAQVRITSPQGRVMWARTDTAGQVWVHPKAFIPAQDAQPSVLDVAVWGYDNTFIPARDTEQSELEFLTKPPKFKAQTQLVRGQKSTVQITLDAASSSAKARLDLVFLIDATGSMGDEIDKLKASLRTIVNDIAQLPSQPDLCLGMVAYRDKGDAFLLRSHDFTNDVNAFQGVLNALQADGGGDYPEAMNEALHDAVHNLNWRGNGTTRLMVLLADAPPHLDYGHSHYDNSAMAALGKGIKIFSVGASGLDKQGEFIQRQIAQYTGGRFVFLTYDKAHNPASGPGSQTVHDVQNYSVDTLDRLVVRLVKDELSRL